MSTVHTGEPTAIGANDRALESGDVVGEYTIQEQLGKGGFGTVYRALHPVIGKQVAIKVLARRYSADEAVVSRFVAEARAVNQIRHRNIIDIFSFGQLADGRHYYVMEMLDGETLDEYLKRTGPLPLATALPIFKAIAKALDAAHAKGIAHRDLKPENIFLAVDDEGERFPKLLDFGIAKLMTPEDQQVKHKTATGAPIGTPYYMSPEQCRGKDVDHRTDIYSFGIVCYRLLTGEYPFDGDGYLDLMMLQINEEAPPPSAKNPDLSPVIDAAIAQMMAKDPAARPKSVAAAVAAMIDGGTVTPSLTPHSLSPRTTRGAAAGSAITGTAPTQLDTPELPKLPARSRMPLYAGIGALAIAGVITAVVMNGGGRGTKEEVPKPAPQAVAPPPAPAPAAPPAPAPPPVEAAPSKNVIIKLVEFPEGTQVKLGDGSIQYAPDIELKRGNTSVLLVLSADGYVPAKMTVTPDEPKTLKVTMKKKQRANGTATPSKDDIFNADKIPGLGGQ